jgi:hypothetical protein
MTQRAFVFVVCGGEEHICTLNFSLIALKNQTNMTILVVTDLKRNELAIDHPSNLVIDVDVSEEYDHHQASIFLKTGLHKFLPMDDWLYCYLDTDVVAVSDDAEKIFDQFIGPIRFASDHCRMNQFSGHAVNCGCFMPKELKERIDHYRNQFSYLKGNEMIINRLVEEWVKFESQFPLERAKIEWFNGLLENGPKQVSKRILVDRRARLVSLTDTNLPFHQLLFNYLFCVFPHFRRSLTSKRWSDTEGNILLDQGRDYHTFMNGRGFFLSQEHNHWKDANGNECPEIPKTFESFFAENGIRYQYSDEAWYTLEGLLFWPNLPKLVEREGSFWYDQSIGVWFDENDKPVSLKMCNHLQQAIAESFSIEVKDSEWQHWNGGVFLFHSESTEFLETWHGLTLNAFKLPYWKTRDQGTLIATVWKFGLQNHPVLPMEFNFIADYYHPTMTYEGEFGFKLRADAPLVFPSLIHIYHNWGNENWRLWRDVSKLVTQSE